MPFFGMSGRGQEAQGFPIQQGRWNDEQYRQFLGRANDFGSRGNYFQNDALGYWNARAQTPQPGVADVRATGEQIMPYQGALDRRAGRFAQMLGNYQSGVTPANTAGGAQRGYLDEAAGNISRTGDYIGNEINDTAGRLDAASQAGYGDIISGLRGQSGRLRDDIGAGYGNIGNILNQGFSGAQSAIEATRPGGELQAATAARSFAPQRANVMRRLIASGVDPNSPEGIAATSDVGERQARAMDDTLGASIERYGDKMANLNLGRGEALSGAQERGLGASANVEANLMRQLPGLQQGGLNQRLGIESYRTAGIIGNMQDTRNQSNQVLGARGQQEQLQRAMQMQDWDSVNSILNQQNQDELTGVGLNQQQFGAGGNFMDWQQGRADMPYDRLSQLSQQDTQNMFRSADQARGFGNDASRNMQQQYEMELPNAGWGTRLLGGLAGGALNVASGGLGGLLGRGISGLGGLFGGSGGGGGMPGSNLPMGGMNRAIDWNMIPGYRR